MYALTNDSIIAQQKAIIDGYVKVTGIQASSIEDLEEIYQIGQAVSKDKDMKIEGLEKNLKSVNRRKNLWKVGTFVLVPTALVGGIVLGVRIAK